MNVTFCLFASAKQIVGQSRINIELESPATIADLKQVIGEQFPDLNDLIRRSAFSVDQEYANEDCPLHEGAEVALIPPVSGG